MHSGHNTRHSRAQLVLTCAAGTTHVTLALSWFSHAPRAQHTPLSRSVGSRMHGGHTTRHSRAQMVFARTAISSLVVADRPSNTMIWRGIAISMIFFYTLCLLHTFPLGFNLTASEPADLFGGKTPGRVFRSARMHTEFQIQITSETAFLNCPCLSLHWGEYKSVYARRMHPYFSLLCSIFFRVIRVCIQCQFEFEKNMARDRIKIFVECVMSIAMSLE